MAGEAERQLLEKVLERRAELSREATALDTLIAYYRGLLVRLGAESPEGLVLPDLYRGTSRRSYRSAQTAQMIEEARRIIVAEKRPMKRSELVKKLAEKGYEATGKDKNKVFGTNIWRSGKFRTIESYGYWPKDVALPKTFSNKPENPESAS